MSGVRDKLERGVVPVGKISFEEYLDWLDEDTLAEWEDGEVIMTSPASLKHQDINGFLFSLLGVYLKLFDLGKLVFAPFVIKLKKTGREPDLIFISNANLGNFYNTYYLGAPDLVVEIVSPESQARDRKKKFSEYEENGVKEYWLIDPTKPEAIFYQLNDEGKYSKIDTDDENRYHSKVIEGFWLDPGWLWRNPFPSQTSVLMKINRTAYRAYLEKILDEEELENL
jgi:Uma2 family endonuclease